MSTNSHVSIQTSSQAVTTTALSANGTQPFIVTQRFGWAIEQPVTVLTGGSSTVVTVAAFTTQPIGS